MCRWMSIRPARSRAFYKEREREYREKVVCEKRYEAKWNCQKGICRCSMQQIALTIVGNRTKPGMRFQRSNLAASPIAWAWNGAYPTMHLYSSMHILSRLSPYCHYAVTTKPLQFVIQSRRCDRHRKRARGNPKSWYAVSCECTFWVGCFGFLVRVLEPRQSLW